MVQVINDPSRQSTGNALGSALSTALQGLASHKIGQMQLKQQQQRTVQGLQAAIPGLSAEKAHGLALLDPKILEHVIKQELARPGEEEFARQLGGGQLSSQGYAPVQSAMQEQPANPYTPAQQEDFYKALRSPELHGANGPEGLNALAQLNQQKSLPIPAQEQLAAQQQQAQPAQQEFNPAHVTQEQRDQLAQYLNTPEVRKSLKPNELEALTAFAATPFQGAVPTPRLTEQQALELAKLDLRKQENTSKRDIAQIKATKEELSDFRKKHKVAKEDLQSLERLEELEKNNELDSETYNAFLEGMGLDLPALRSPGSQEFNKIVNNFIRNIKDIFGARISNQELEQFMLTLPNLSQSPEGRKRVIANLKKVARTNYEYGKVAQEILRDHKGIPPIDIADQVEERIDKRLDKVSDQFKVDLKRPVPESGNKLGVALSYGAGKAIPVTGGAVLGGLVGGPIGAALGGALGGFGKSIFSVFSK